MHAEAKTCHPRAYAFLATRDLDYEFEGGENLRTFAQRITDSLAAIASRHRGECVLVVAHGGVLDIAYRLATARPLDAQRDFPISNAGLSWIESAGNEWRLLSWNEPPQNMMDGLNEL